MGTQKMSLANIKGKLSRAEMKNIMAGSEGSNISCFSTAQCVSFTGNGHTCCWPRLGFLYPGTCHGCN